MTSRQTTALVETKLDKLQYARWNLSGVNLNAELKSAVASVRLTSDNELLKMQSEADLRLDRKYMDGRLNMKVEELDLYNLGIASEPLEHPVAFNLGAEARRDSIKLRMDAGDMDLQFRARSTLDLASYTRHTHNYFLLKSSRGVLSTLLFYKISTTHCRGLISL